MDGKATEAGWPRWLVPFAASAAAPSGWFPEPPAAQIVDIDAGARGILAALLAAPGRSPATTSQLSVRDHEQSHNHARRHVAAGHGCRSIPPNTVSSPGPGDSAAVLQLCHLIAEPFRHGSPTKGQDCLPVSCRRHRLPRGLSDRVFHVVFRRAGAVLGYSKLLRARGPAERAKRRMLVPNWAMTASCTAMCPPRLVGRSPWASSRLRRALAERVVRRLVGPTGPRTTAAAAAVARRRRASASIRRAVRRLADLAQFSRVDEFLNALASRLPAHPGSFSSRWETEGVG